MKSQEVRSFSLLLSGVDLVGNNMTIDDWMYEAEVSYRLAVVMNRHGCRSHHVVFSDLFSASHSLFSFTYDKGVHGVYEGVCQMEDMLIEKNPEDTIIVNVERRSLLKAKDVHLKEIKQNETLDLSVDGDRWEGDVLNGKPCGWGVLYDKENNKTYEGFRIGEKNVCYGHCYYPDIERIEYEGEICDGMRWGRGIQYDRNGTVVYKGEWINDCRIEKRLEVMRETTGSLFLHPLIEDLIIGNCCFSENGLTVLDLQEMTRLRTLRIGSSSFHYVSRLKLIDLPDLVSVSIGSCCFNSGYVFIMKDCGSVKSLKMGRDTFPHGNCIIENTPFLEFIEIGVIGGANKSGCFISSSLKLKGGDRGMS